VRILFVAMSDSVHTARWLNVLSEQWDVHLFPAQHIAPNAELRNVTLYDVEPDPIAAPHPSVRVRRVAGEAGPGSRGLLRLASRTRPSRADYLAQVIGEIRPDILHSHEFQHAAYLTLEARSRVKGRWPPWITTAWGSDLYLFGQLREHGPKIRAVLEACDYFSSDCARDFEIARALGFRGEILGATPLAGGFDLDELQLLRQPGPPSGRRTIALKAAQSVFGRGQIGLRAIELAADALRDYEIVLYLASHDVRSLADRLAMTSGLRFRTLSHLPTATPNDVIAPYEDILRMHGYARLSIGLSLSDGLPVSFVEALAMGSFPIQSHTSCAGDWIRDGVTGILVHPIDPEAVAAAIRRVVADDALVDRAAEENERTAAHFSPAATSSRILGLYGRLSPALA
jgi:glycosyltransferase involved in cell wall biosynthesis